MGELLFIIIFVGFVVVLNLSYRSKEHFGWQYTPTEIERFRINNEREWEKRGAKPEKWKAIDARYDDLLAELDERERRKRHEARSLWMNKLKELRRRIG